MRILFVHQNFPAQFKHLAPALALRHEVQALTLNQRIPNLWEGIPVTHYQVQRGSTPGIHSWLISLETQIIRGEAVFYAALSMRQAGYMPDVIVAHPGWGESLFIKDVWPHAHLGIYCEFFYHPSGSDVGFDSEFPESNTDVSCRMRMKNINNLLHFDTADAGLAPTRWQASTFPAAFNEKISIIHDGIDTDVLTANPNISLTLNNTLTLTRADEVITFVNRNLEPYRGYHIFMRALPALLKQRPRARILIVGSDGVSYGAKPAGEQSWKEIFIREVRSQISDADWSRVHFLGYLPYAHFVALLQCSTVHVYLTYPFVLSWSLLEAMSIGCAIVASDTLPLLEAIRHNETGLLVNFFDPQALAEAIVKLLDDPAERRRLGRNACAFAQATYDLKTVCLPRQLQWVEALAGLSG
ncbi:MAG TPA: glycosyl transferase [Verrucomicrobia bacterium]|nr:glycosyl transferase [Verrucomicrobiota bacterium]